MLSHLDHHKNKKMLVDANVWENRESASNSISISTRKWKFSKINYLRIYKKSIMNLSEISIVIYFHVVLVYKSKIFFSGNGTEPTSAPPSGWSRRTDCVSNFSLDPVPGVPETDGFSMEISG